VTLFEFQQNDHQKTIAPRPPCDIGSVMICLATLTELQLVINKQTNKQGHKTCGMLA